MSEPRYRSTPRRASVARGLRAPLAAAALLGAALGPAAAEAQEFAYCDLAVAQQASKLQKNGNATVVSNGPRKRQGIRVTEEKMNQRSSAFHNVPITFAPGTSFYQHFRVRISGTLGNMPPNGADGFSFMIQNDPGGDPLMVGSVGGGITALGIPGEGFGYAGITQSIALEIDTYENGALMDPDGNHLTLIMGGLVGHTKDGTAMGEPLMPQPEGSTVVPFQPVQVMSSFESTSASADTRDIWIDYECAAADSCTMKVYVSFNNTLLDIQFADPTNPGSLPQKPDMPVMVVEGLKDIAGYLNGAAGFAGFSASTGSAMDEHLVTFWVLSRSPLPDTNMNNLEDTCECKTVDTACGGNLPICEPKTDQGYCRDCLTDDECAMRDPTMPYCDLIVNGGTGACVECNEDAQCPTEKPFCNTVTKSCTASCSDDAHCDAKKWCDNPTGAPFGGTCSDDLPNGSPIPKSGNHTPPLEGACTPEAAAAVCVSGVCDEADDQCGYSTGGPCTTDNAADVCRSGLCSSEGTCTCKEDTHCGDASSGRVCDADKGACVDGCRGSGGNGCPSGLQCSSTSADVGECRQPGVGPGPQTPDDGTVEGSGFLTCGASRRGASGDPAALLFFAALAGHLVRRRRR
ncbi:MAG TPA: L-type lectin-domain containing protein [Polyangiaceae bacterium]|nr:L-type lectin-domain containing protein [Polyangiaceae bacterium]